MIIALQIKHHALTTGHLVTYVGLEDRRQRRHGHIATQIEARIGMLVVATGGTVATIMGILLQTVDAIGRGDVRGVANQPRGTVGILFGQDDLLTPVASDVAHESRTGARATVGSPSALL